MQHPLGSLKKAFDEPDIDVRLGQDVAFIAEEQVFGDFLSGMQ